MLELIQWSAEEPTGFHQTQAACPDCRNSKKQGHALSCDLAAAIETQCEPIKLNSCSKCHSDAAIWTHEVDEVQIYYGNCLLAGCAKSGHKMSTYRDAVAQWNLANLE